MSYSGEVLRTHRVGCRTITLVRQSDGPDMRDADRLIAEAEQGRRLSRKEMIERSRANRPPEWWELSSSSDSAEELAMRNIGSLPTAEQRRMQRAVKVYRQGQGKNASCAPSELRQREMNFRKEKKEAERQADLMKPRQFSYGYQQRVDELKSKLDRCKYQIFQTSKYVEFIKPALSQQQKQLLEKAKSAKLGVLADKAYRASGTDVCAFQSGSHSACINRTDRTLGVRPSSVELRDVSGNFKYTQPRAPAWDIGALEKPKKLCLYDDMGPGKYDLRKFTDWRTAAQDQERDFVDYV